MSDKASFWLKAILLSPVYLFLFVFTCIAFVTAFIFGVGYIGGKSMLQELERWVRGYVYDDNDDSDCVTDMCCETKPTNPSQSQ